MGELYFKAELLDDVVLSQKTATVGDHKSLDYIPGSVFLGIAASRLYSKVSAEDAWTLFHSSKVRFCNAYPMTGKSRTLPIPFSLHSEKVPRIGKEDAVYNFVHSGLKDEKIQYRQNRCGYVSVDGEKLVVVAPSKTSRMRTAIDSKTGTAAKGQLYGYESLNAGQIFVGKIEWDDSVSELAKPVADIFSSDEVVHAGRSKNASYGRVQVSKIDVEKKDAKNLSGSSFSILAVSDLCLRNPLTGCPELNLLPSFLGLGDNWKLDRSKSFSRPSCLCQFNAYRKEIEMQKTLVSKGSVFTFESDKEMSANEKEKILAAVKNGVGDARGQGFGEIALFDFGKEFAKSEFTKDNSAVVQTLAPEEINWLEWLEPLYIGGDVEIVVKDAVAEFVTLCKKIRVYQTFDSETLFWPGNAQWGRILDASRLCDTKKMLVSKLFEEENCVIKPVSLSKTEKHGDEKSKNPDKEWNYEASPQGETLRKWLIDFVNNKDMDDKKIKIALQELVKRCKDTIAYKNWLGGGSK